MKVQICFRRHSRQHHISQEITRVNLWMYLGPKIATSYPWCSSLEAGSHWSCCLAKKSYKLDHVDHCSLMLEWNEAKPDLWADAGLAPCFNSIFTNCSTIVPSITPLSGLLTIIIYEFAFQLQPRNPSFSSSGKSPSVAGSSLGHMCQCGSALWPRRNWTFTILSLMVIRQICWASTCGQVWTIPPKHESKWNLVTLYNFLELNGIPESILLGMDCARRYVCTFSITAAIWSVCVWFSHMHIYQSRATWGKQIWHQHNQYATNELVFIWCKDIFVAWLMP